MVDDVILDKDGFITIESTDFFGQYHKSRNGVYIIAWVDYSREPDLGKYVLLERKQIIFQGNLKRPNDGKVADNGNFILNDWLFGSGTQGDFFAFDKSGRQLTSRSYSANLLSNGLSVDGSFAVCQTASSKTIHSGILSFFNLNQGRMVWEQKPITGWADSFDFDLERGTLQLVYKGVGRFRYSFIGEFLDEDKWNEARIRHGTGFDLVNIALEKREVLKDILTNNNAQEIIDLLEIALTRLSSFPYHLARVHRIIGEIYERLGRFDSAIINYEKALNFYPKIGVKKKIGLLRNQIRK
jgi:tetratricopeptide (TPR) repeat protein